MGWLPVLTDWCGAMFFHIHRRSVGVSNSAVSLNRLGLFYICRDNLSMWEKIACGEVEDVVPSPPYDSGPVKVDNWLPKSLLARQRNTTCILPRTSYSVRGRSHILCCRDTDQLRATWLWKLLPHWVTEVSTLMVSPTPETNGLSTGGLKPITLHPHSLRIHLVEWTVVFFMWAVLCVRRPYSEPLAG